MIKTLSRSVRQFKFPAFFAMLTMAVEVFAEIMIPAAMADMIDFGIEPGIMANVTKYGVMLLLFTVIQLAGGVLSAVFAARASAGFSGNLRKDLYDRVQTFSFANLDKFSTASLVTRMTTDVTNVQMAFMVLVRMAVRAPVMLVLAMIFSMRINLRISLVFLAAIPVLALGLYLVMGKVHPLFRRVFQTYDKLNRVVQENLRGIRVVKSFNREAHEIEKFGGISQTIYKDFSKADRLISLIFPLMMFCVYGCMIALSWLGAGAIVASGNDAALGLTTGDLTALISYEMQILMSLMMLGMMFSMLTISQASGERIAEVLTEETLLKSPEKPVKSVPDGSVRFENVDFVYNSTADKKVLRGINLVIRPGQTVGILGSTGAAKTSLVQLIPRLYDAAAGSVKVGGVDVRDYELNTLRREVAMVLQKNVLFSGTIAENLRWGNEHATDAELEEVCKLACVHEFVSGLPLGYDTYIEQGGSNVSGGQKQRLCIARALLRRPKILILDDSTSAVDTKTDSQIQRALRDYLPETTKITIAQRVTSVMSADLILVMDDGAVLETGTHEELLKSNRIYREVYESQQKGGGELDG
jgi:ATP-binding cassette subfamily B protein